MNRQNTRRDFLKTTALLGAGYWVAGGSQAAESRSANEKLNIGVIGAAGRGAADTGGCASQNIAALCDVNEKNLAQAANRFPKAKTYRDWRKLLQQKDLDAVIVATTDHTHAPASVWAMRRGKHVYCEKPLAHTVHEARMVQETCKKAKVATQMGTQIHATDNYRRVVELIRGGAIGPVREAHVWCSRVGATPARPKETPPVPKELDWDLWLGPAPQRPYHPSYLPGCMTWEQHWDWGNGCLGDMGSHLIDLPFWALDLRDPTSVEAEGEPRSDESYPHWLIARWEHPARGDRPALALTWYDGVKRPPSPPDQDLQKWGIGVLFVGDKGKLLADYGRRILLPEEQYKDFKAPSPTIPPSPGHYQEWINACKTGSPTLCNFDYSGKMIEHNLLGTVAYRVNQKLEWDAVKMQATNCPQAERFIQGQYREGWGLEG
jgi:predicted dehydrogenase